MSKIIQMIVSKEFYENAIVREEIEKKVSAALPSGATQYGLEWRCLVSLEDPTSERWVCAINYTEAGEEPLR